MSIKYDYLIVGAGPFGCVFAHEMRKVGKKVLIIDKRDHIAGNTYTKNIEGINVHRYGAHIFHTSDDKIWEYVNQFSKFNHYVNSPIANYKGELYNLPFNMNTFYKLWKVRTPEEAKKIIEKQTNNYKHIKVPKNLEEQALKLAGDDIYYKLIKGYTEKQWGTSAKELPPFIIKRLPFRFTFDNNYFNDKYQGIPSDGYTKLFQKMIDGIEVRLGVDYFENKEELDNLAHKIVYTGKIDEFFNYKYGQLEYRSLKFEDTLIETENYQGNAVVNYTDRSVPYTRIIEHKHFQFGKQPVTIITKEYPITDSTKSAEPYYPINNEKNQKILKKYKDLAQVENSVIFGGRLAEYRYYDMHQVIGSALKKVTIELENDSL